MSDVVIILILTWIGYSIPYSTWSLDRLVLIIPIFLMACIIKGVLDYEE